MCVFAHRGIERDSSPEHANKVNGWRRCDAVGACCSDDGKNNSKDFGGCAASVAAETAVDLDTWHVSCKMRKSFQNKLENFQLLCGLMHNVHKRAHNLVNIRRLHRFNLCLHVLRVKSIKPFAITCLESGTTKRMASHGTLLTGNFHMLISFRSPLKMAVEMEKWFHKLKFHWPSCSRRWW